MESFKQSRRFLESVDNDFLVQILDRLTRDKALLDLVPNNVEEIAEEIKIRSSLACSERALVKFVISGMQTWKRIESGP